MNSRGSSITTGASSRLLAVTGQVIEIPRRATIMKKWDRAGLRRGKPAIAHAAYAVGGPLDSPPLSTTATESLEPLASQLSPGV
ncbi:MAG TPA: hypothetical protein VIX73_36305 [Kofleriaceae bacterium]|jgi:hypothetical protein